MKIKFFTYIIILFSLGLNNLYAIDPDIFVQSTVNRASKVLSENISKEKNVRIKIILRKIQLI